MFLSKLSRIYIWKISLRSFPICDLTAWRWTFSVFKELPFYIWHVCRTKTRLFHSLISFKLSLRMDNYRISLWHLLCERDDVCYWKSCKRISPFVDYLLNNCSIYSTCVGFCSSFSFHLIFKFCHNPSVLKVYDLCLYYKANKQF